MKKRRSVLKAPKKSSAVKKAEPMVEEYSEAGRPKEIPSGQIRNIVADTIERMYDEMGGEINRPSAEQFADFVVLFVKHGIIDSFITDKPKLREKSLKPALCKSCK